MTGLSKKKTKENIISKRVSNKCISKKKRRNRNEKKNAAADNDGNESEGLNLEIAKLIEGKLVLFLFLNMLLLNNALLNYYHHCFKKGSEDLEQQKFEC